jgi:hypothetical protein
VESKDEEEEPETMGQEVSSERRARCRALAGAPPSSALSSRKKGQLEVEQNQPKPKTGTDSEKEKPGACAKQVTTKIDEGEQKTGGDCRKFVVPLPNGVSKPPLLKPPELPGSASQKFDSTRLKGDAYDSRDESQSAPRGKKGPVSKREEMSSDLKAGGQQATPTAIKAEEEQGNSEQGLPMKLPIKGGSGQKVSEKAYSKNEEVTQALGETQVDVQDSNNMDSSNLKVVGSTKNRFTKADAYTVAASSKPRSSQPARAQVKQRTVTSHTKPGAPSKGATWQVVDLGRTTVAASPLITVRQSVASVIEKWRSICQRHF